MSNGKNFITRELRFSNEAEKKAWETLLSIARLSSPISVVESLEKEYESQNERSGEEVAREIEAFLRPKLESISDRLGLTSFRVSAWNQKQGGEFLHSVKAGFNLDEKKSIERFVERLEEGISKYTPNRIEPVTPKTIGNKFGVINFSDLHLDKMTTYEETGEDSDIWKNIEKVAAIFDELLQYQKDQGCEKIAILIGNDLNNVNDYRNSTVKGTPQSTYIHHVDAWEITLNFWIEQIDKALQVAPIEIIGIPGNHARDMENMICKALKQVYRHNENINFFSSRIERKVIAYGENLFFFEHGHNFNKANYAGSMAAHYSELWHKHSNRYCFLGHFHQEKAFDLPGIMVMVARGTCENDEYHFANGYLGTKKTAYAHWFSEDGCNFQTMRRIF